MIKFRVIGNNGALLGFGLSEENIKRLKAGNPIYFDLAELGVDGFQVAIIYGETEEQIKQDMQKSGITLP